ncbi:GNAT family N-acetyltransferase [Arthrobacter alpinus]|uniref:GNAT family N-acetyltransferase n=1 Tax=Arthrobacter alpinus TaxID=656366 RepID=UPI0005CB2822
MSVPHIRLMADADWAAVERIYALGIATGSATFEDSVPAKSDFFDAKIPELSLVAEDPDGTVAGWASASPSSSRAAYRGVVEHSIYVDPGQSGRGIAKLLLQALIEQAGIHGYWTIQSGIFAENTASRTLHLKMGFREIGYRERIAQLASGPSAGEWQDTFLYEIRL